MTSSELEAKKRIIKAAIELLDEEQDVNKITVRRIAERAKVGIGLVNYHFKSKENLLYQSVADTMGDLATNLLQKSGPHDSPVAKLKNMLNQLSDFAIHYNKYLDISVTYELLHGNLETPLFITPILREIFGEDKDEVALRIMALQIITTMQVIYLRSAAFKIYSGMDIFDDKQRKKLVDALVDNLIK